jgi:FkbM family methyltransferase
MPGDRSRVHGDNELGVHETEGARFYFRKGTVDEYVLTSEYQRPRFFAPRYRPRSTDTILDVGAHIGVFTALAARAVPSGTVHAIEPATENIELLRRNVEVNRLGNVRVHHVALGAATKQVDLFHDVDNWGHSTCEPSVMEAAVRREPVRAYSLTDFLESNDVRRVDYLKMNAEGAEYEILRAAPAPVVRRIGTMLIECHPHGPDGATGLAGWLRARGFRAEIEWAGHKYGKGWLVAWSNH